MLHNIPRHSSIIYWHILVENERQSYFCGYLWWKYFSEKLRKRFSEKIRNSKFSIENQSFSESENFSEKLLISLKKCSNCMRNLQSFSEKYFHQGFLNIKNKYKKISWKWNADRLPNKKKILLIFCSNFAHRIGIKFDYTQLS